MVDTDILLGGFGLFGGRGEYVGKIKLFDIGNAIFLQNFNTKANFMPVLLIFIMGHDGRNRLRKQN